MTSGGHCDGDEHGQIWLFWEVGACGLKDALRWEKEEGQGGKGPLFLGIVPLCHSAAPWAQGLPSTSPYVPWAPAPSSPHAWGALDTGWWPQCSRKIVATGAFSSFSPILYQPDGSFMLFPLYLGPGTRGQYLRGSRAALSCCKQSVSALRLNTIQKKLELFSCPPSVDCFFFFHVGVQSKNSTL